MNRGKRIKMLKKIILKYGDIITEYNREPEKYYHPYRKGSYYMNYQSKSGNYSGYIGAKNKYEVYKAVVKDIKMYEHDSYDMEVFNKPN